MTALVLVVWVVCGCPVALAEPWSGWFVALVVAALMDTGS